MFAVTSAGVVVEDGGAKPEEQDLLGLAVGAGSRTRRRRLLPLEISGCRLLTWKCLPLFWRRWNDRTEAESLGLWYQGIPVARIGRWERELKKYIYWILHRLEIVWDMLARESATPGE